MSHRHQPTATNKKTIKSNRNSGTSTKNAPSSSSASARDDDCCSYRCWPADGPVDDNPPSHPNDAGDDAAFASSTVVGPALQAIRAADVHIRIPRHSNHKNNQPHQFLCLLPGRLHLREDDPNDNKSIRCEAPPPPQPSSSTGTRTGDDDNVEEEEEETVENGASSSSNTTSTTTAAAAAAAGAAVSAKEEDAANTPSATVTKNTTIKTAAVRMVTLGRLSGIQQSPGEEGKHQHPIVLTLGATPHNDKDPNPNPRSSVLQFRGCQVNSQSKFLILKVPNRTKYSSNKKKKSCCNVICTGIFSTVTVLGGATELVWPNNHSERKGSNGNLPTVFGSELQPQQPAAWTPPNDDGNHDSSNRHEPHSKNELATGSPTGVRDSLHRAREMPQVNDDDDDESSIHLPPMAEDNDDDDDKQETPRLDSVASPRHTLELQCATPAATAAAPTNSYKKYPSSPSRRFPTDTHESSSSSNHDNGLVHSCSENTAAQNRYEIVVDSSSNSNNQRKRRSSQRLQNNNNRELKLEQPEDCSTQKDDDTNASEWNDKDDCQPPPVKKRAVRRSATTTKPSVSMKPMAVRRNAPAKTVPSPLTTEKTTRQTVAKKNSLEPMGPLPNGSTVVAVNEEQSLLDGTDSSTAVTVVQEQPPSTRSQRQPAVHSSVAAAAAFSPRDRSGQSPGATSSPSTPLSARKRRRPLKKLAERSILELANDDEFAFMEE